MTNTPRPWRGGCQHIVPHSRVTLRQAAHSSSLKGLPGLSFTRAGNLSLNAHMKLKNTVTLKEWLQ